MVETVTIYLFPFHIPNAGSKELQIQYKTDKSYAPKFNQLLQYFSVNF